MKKEVDKMIYKIIDILVAENYKNTFLDYFREVLEINNVKDIESATIYENMINYINDGSAHIIGAFTDTLLVGFIWFYEIITNDDKKYHVNYFIVNSDYRKKGIGKELMEQVYNIAKENNISKIELNVTYKNKNAVNFYLKNGFEIERISLCKNI